MFNFIIISLVAILAVMIAERIRRFVQKRGVKAPFSFLAYAASAFIIAFGFGAGVALIENLFS